VEASGGREGDIFLKLGAMMRVSSVSRPGKRGDQDELGGREGDDTFLSEVNLDAPDHQ
jgi:hypothetical protein